MIGRCKQWVSEWLSENIYFSKAAFFSLGLIASQSLVEYGVKAVFVLYLTEDASFTILKAAIIVNGMDFLIGVQLIAWSHIADVYTGRFKMVIYATVAYFMGSLVSLSFLLKFIPKMKFWLYYLPLYLYYLGKAMQENAVKNFISEHMGSEAAPKIVRARTNFWWSTGRAIGAVPPLFYFNRKYGYSPFSLTFSMVTMAVASSIFSYGYSIYANEKLYSSPLSVCFGVVKRAIGKRHEAYPKEGIPPRLKGFRWLDKAAIIQRSAMSSNQEEALDRGRMDEVKQIKGLLRFIPLFCTLFVFSTVQGAGLTIFYQQILNMNEHFLGRRIPEVAFYMIQKLSSSVSSWLYDSFVREQWKYFSAVKMVLGMVFPILSIVAAMLVEHHKDLQRISLDGLCDTDRSTCMSVLWLAPQFCLLGIMNGLTIEGLEEFLRDRLGRLVKDYVPLYIEFAQGLGRLISILTLILSKHYLDQSTENPCFYCYYRVLVIASAINQCIFMVLVSCYIHANIEAGDEELKQDMGDLELDDINNEVDDEELDIEYVNDEAGDEELKLDKTGLEMEDANDDAGDKELKLDIGCREAENANDEVADEELKQDAVGLEAEYANDEASDEEARSLDGLDVEDADNEAGTESLKQDRCGLDAEDVNVEAGDEDLKLDIGGLQGEDANDETGDGELKHDTGGLVRGS